MKLVDLHIKPNTKIMMMGSKEEDVVSGKSLSSTAARGCKCNIAHQLKICLWV